MCHTSDTQFEVGKKLNSVSLVVQFGILKAYRPVSDFGFFFLNIKYQLLNMLFTKIKRDINQQDFKIVTTILSNMNNFHAH